MLRSFDRRKVGHAVGTILSVGLFVVSMAVLAHVVANINLGDLHIAITNTHGGQFAAAAALTALSYLALTGYDATAMRQLGRKVAYRVTAFGSFTSYAISFTLGFPLITGGTVRYWIYSRVGLTPGKVATLTVMAGITFWLGMACVVAVSFLSSAEAVSKLNYLAPWMNRAIGAGILATTAAYLVWVARGRRRVRFQGFRLQLPGPVATVGQMTLGMVDVCAAAGVLYVLLPTGHNLDFLTFLGLYVFACMLGIASHSPGGIGVFEATMLRFITGVSGEAVFAALLLFRVIYYLVPFVLALALLGANESMRRWTRLREAMSRAGDSEDET